MFNPHQCENSRPDGFGVLEIESGPAGTDPGYRRFVPLRRTELRGSILGPLASLKLLQTFAYRRADCDRTLEVVYRFPLPGDAAVAGVRARFGDVDLWTKLEERQAAEASYTAAKREARQAALVTRESPDVFTLRLTGVRPDEEIQVETTFVQLAQAEGAGWTLRCPLTTAPRYVRSDEANTRAAEAQPLASLRDPGHRFRLELTLEGAAGVTSPTHGLTVNRDGDRLVVGLTDAEVIPDRDCVLHWRAGQETDRASLQVLHHADAESDQLSFLALVAPPAVRDRGKGVPREVVLLVDHSGSMQGAKWQAADWAVERFVSDLSDRDAFALGVFHNTTRWMTSTVVSGGPDRAKAAVAFLKASRDSGGTELGVALEQALGLNRKSGVFARHLVIITDAEVTDAGRILRLADGERTRPTEADRRRISVLCIDAAPNAPLATELAERGGGVARFLTSSPDEGDIATALDELLADWAEPVLHNLRLEVDRPAVEASGRRTFPGSEPGWSGIDLGDLPAGRAVWVAGRCPRGSANDLRVRVRTGNHEVVACRVETGKASPRPAVKALFAARRIRGLEYLTQSGYSGPQLREKVRDLGYDPAAVFPPASSLYPENAAGNELQTLKAFLIRESLAVGLACSETAFVASRTVKGQPVEETAVVPNAVPAGWNADRGANVTMAGAVLCAPASASIMRVWSAPLPSAVPDTMSVDSVDCELCEPPPAAKSRPGWFSQLRSLISPPAPPAAPAAPVRGWRGGATPPPAARPSFSSRSGAPAAAPGGAPTESFDDLKRQIQTKLVEKLDISKVADGDALRDEIRLVTERLCDTENPLLDRGQRDRLVNEVLGATFGGTVPPGGQGKDGPLFGGRPSFTNGRAVLFDSTSGLDPLPGTATFTALLVTFPDGAPSPDGLDDELMVLVYVGDAAAPRARVRVSDLIRQRGSRPLNLSRQPGQLVKVELTDPAGVWAANAPRLEVRLVCS